MCTGTTKKLMLYDDSNLQSGVALFHDKQGNTVYTLPPGTEITEDPN